MRIEYKILWVEDDKSWYETAHALFFDTLEELGFKLISKRCENINDVKQEVEKNQLQEYDLLLIDFTLKNHDTGDSVISFLRKLDSPILTDVLFYSSAVENVRDSMRTLGLEGVYTADRKEIDSKFEQVVKTTIKKIQEVNNIRGLIMAETSDLDDLMLDIIIQALNTDINRNLTLSDYLSRKMVSTIDDISKKGRSKETSLQDKINDSRIFTSTHKALGINKICKINQTNITDFYETYKKDIISVRNVFAHVKEEVNSDGMKILKSKKGDNEVFSEERCIEIRKHLIKYREQLEEIRKTIK